MPPPEVSTYHLALHIRASYEGMLIAVPAEHWPPWHRSTLEHLAKWLLQLACLVNLRQVATNKRKPKRAVVKEYGDFATTSTHHATTRILEQARIPP